MASTDRCRRLALANALLAVSLALLLACAGPATAARPTGRYLVTFERDATARTPSAVAAVVARAGAAKAGRGVPALRIATVRGSAEAIRRLRRDPAIQSVSIEWARELRRVPNDPALLQEETEFTTGVPPGTRIQWALAREGFARAWDIATGGGAIVGHVDSGVDAFNPDLAGKIASADVSGAVSPFSDEDGHGTHTGGLACAGTDNAIGIAGAGWGCRLAVVKLGTDSLGSIRDEDVIDGIRIAVDRGSDSINMSFGGGPSSPALRQVIDYAVARNVVLVASASNDPVVDQGAPASILQPDDGFDIDSGRGLVVTAAEFDDTRAGTGFGPQISLAAYGFFDDGADGPPGLISTYSRNPTPREGATPVDGCDCRRSMADGNHYAYLQGTSMSAPQVSALAALVADVNPLLTLREKLRIIKETARRSGDWNQELGWGIIDAGRAVEVARRVDRVAPRSRARAKRRVRMEQGRRRARLRVRFSRRDPAGSAVLLPTGVRDLDLYARRGNRRYRRIRKATRRSSLVLRLRPGVYRLYTRARDAAGNREARPRRADVRVVVRPPR